MEILTSSRTELHDSNNAKSIVWPEHNMQPDQLESHWKYKGILLLSHYFSREASVFKAHLLIPQFNSYGLLNQRIS